MAFILGIGPEPLAAFAVEVSVEEASGLVALTPYPIIRSSYPAGVSCLVPAASVPMDF